MPQIKRVWELKYTCKSCGNIWFYGKKEVMESEQADVNALLEGEASLNPCCLPLLLIPRKKGKSINFGSCPKCGSDDITKEGVTHEV